MTVIFFRQIKSSLMLIFFLLTANSIYAETIPIDKSLHKETIGTFVQYIEDKDKNLKLEDVTSSRYEDKWQRSKRTSLGFGFTDSVYWVRFELKNSTESPIDFFLSQEYPLIDNIRLYIPENGKYKILETGDLKPFKQRPVENRKFIFPLTLGAGETSLYYMRFESGSAMNIVLHLLSPKDFKSVNFNEYLLLMLFYGIIIIMVVYNLMVFFFIRRSEYLYYALFVLFMILFWMTQEGTAFQFLWPEHPWWANFCIPVLMSLLMIFVQLFAFKLVDLKGLQNKKPYLKKLYLISNVFVGSSGIILLVTLIFPYRTAMSTSVVFTTVSLAFIGLMALILIIKERNRPAMFGITAAAAIILGSFAYILKTFGLLPTTFLTEWSTHIGSVVMVVLFSIALSDRINIMKKNLDVTTKNLQNKTEIISAMLKFGNKINSLNDLDAICDSIMDMVIRFIDIDRISIMLLDDEKKNLVIKGYRGIPSEIALRTRIKIGEGIAGKVFQEGKLIVINDIESQGLEKKYSDFDAFISYPFLCAPLAGPNVKLGVINITNKKNNQAFTEEEVDIISYISDTAAIAINNQVNEIKLEDSFLGTIKSLAEAVEAKDPYTRGHSDRVAKIAVAIAIQMELSREIMRSLKYAGILHDIGKIGIAESVLGKPDKLNREEFELVKRHPEIGESILKDIKLLEEAREIIRHHHERLNGKGYPDGLKGPEISLGARIMAVADTFDAMYTDRPYRKRIDLNTIIEELNTLSGKTLDPECVKGLFKYLKEKKEIYGES